MNAASWPGAASPVMTRGKMASSGFSLRNSMTDAPDCGSGKTTQSNSTTTATASTTSTGVTTSKAYAYSAPLAPANRSNRPHNSHDRYSVLRLGRNFYKEQKGNVHGIHPSQ